MADAGHSADVFHHVRDADVFELPKFMGGELHLPMLEFLPSPTKMLLAAQGHLPEGESIMGLQVTRFMVLQVVAAVLVLLIARGLAIRVSGGQPVRGRWWNFWETLALFIRDEVVRPTIGTGHHDHDHSEEHHHDSHGDGLGHDADLPAGDHGHHSAGDTSGAAGMPSAHAGESVALGGAAALQVGHPADRYLPYVWSCFFYVLFCNLLGAFPWMGSATGEINVTAALALTTLGAVMIYGSAELGFVGFWKALAPTMDLPGPLKIFLVPMIWLIELLGFAIKHGVLAVRLFANIMGGHTVLAVILGFIAMEGVVDSDLFYLVAPASIFGQVFIGLLELFVAFLQAYVFAFLASLFISAAVHPH
ncbi:MAG: F0F1 ATP synthase subunit A [Planctomycetaceae bacterium]|nr:F0F1 ATP synthase subunit A [Planctomycetaceae bacterium]